MRLALLLAFVGLAPATFGLVATYSTGATGSYPTNVAVADVNGDGRPDVLAANNGTSTLAVLLGNGAGSFSLQANAPSTGAGSNPNGLVLADVNGDGRPDALTANNGTHSVGVLLGTGSGGFTLQTPPVTTSTTSGPYSLAVADVNGDGKPDVLAANNGTNLLDVLLGNGAGGFALQTPVPSASPSSGPQSVAVADVNNDGRPDALVANYSAGTVSVLLGNGSGGFTLQPNAPGTGAGGLPQRLVVADVNNDGKPDALLANFGTNTVGVLLNTTTFLPTITALPGAGAILAPNPVRISTTLTATGLPAAAHAVQATLFNPLGQETRRLTVPATGGAATATMPIAGLAAGLYLLRLEALDAQGAALGALPVQRLSVE